MQSGLKILVTVILSLQLLALPVQSRQVMSSKAASLNNVPHIASNVPAPKDVIGFTPGDDRKLAAWSQVVDYFNALAKNSDRVLVQEIGKTTLGRPFIYATISSPENLKNLDRYLEIQRKLSDPRLIKDEAEVQSLMREGKTVVLCTFQIHSTEVG